RNLAKRIPDALLVFGSVHVEIQIRLPLRMIDDLGELSDRIGEPGGVFLDDGAGKALPKSIGEARAAIGELESDKTPIGCGRNEIAKRALTPGVADMFGHGVLQSRQRFFTAHIGGTSSPCDPFLALI